MPLTPWESPLLRATKTGSAAPFLDFPRGGLILRWKMTIPAPVSGFGLVRFGCACVEWKFLVCACQGCVLLFECYSAAQPLAALPPYGCGVPLAGAARLCADAVRGCWGGRYTPLLLLQIVLPCNCVTVKNTPSSRRHPQSPPTAAARWCALARLHLSSALRQQQRKEKHHKTSLPQCIPYTLEQTTHNKKRAPYRTHPKHCTSAECGQ